MIDKLKYLALLFVFVSSASSARLLATEGGMRWYCMSLGTLYQEAIGLRNMGVSPKVTYRTVSRSAKWAGFKGDEAKQAVNNVYFNSDFNGLSVSNAADSVGMACIHEAQGWHPVK